MTVAAVAPDRGRTGVVGVGRVAPGRTEALSVAAPPVHRLELDTLTSQWQRALDAAQMALAAAAVSLSAAELVRRQRELTLERREVAESLARMARAAGVRPAPWLSQVPVTASSLGLPAGISAGLFDLDGVLTDSGLIHASAWGEVFDEFLLRLSEKTGWHFIPFDRVADYRAYIEGRQRLEGVHAFLRSRGIRLPEGRADEPAGADTAYGLARRKGEVPRSRVAPSRCDRCCRSASLSRGRRSRRAHTSSGLGECEHADDARAGWARELGRDANRRPSDQRRGVAVTARPRLAPVCLSWPGRPSRRRRLLHPQRCRRRRGEGGRGCCHRSRRRDPKAAPVRLWRGAHRNRFECASRPSDTPTAVDPESHG